MKAVNYLILITLILCAGAQAADAYSIDWSMTNGPWAGVVKKLVMPTQESKSDVIYALASGRAIFESEDGGATWTNMVVQGMDVNVYDMAIDHANPDVMYAGGLTGTYGVKVTTDEGQTWGNIPGIANPQFGYVMNGLVVDPNDSSVLYAASGTDIYRIDVDDATPSWEGVGSDLPASGSIDDLFIEPSKSYLFLNLSHYTYGGTYRSTDEGKSWQKFFPGAALDSSPYKPSRIYMRTGSSLHTSTNEGDSWHSVPLSPFTSIGELAVYPKDPSVVYAVLDNQLRLSVNSGDSWAPAYFGLPDRTLHAVTDIAVSPVDSREAYVCLDGDGIYKTENAGQSWSRASEGFVNIRVSDIAVDPDTGYVYAGTQAEIVRPASGLWRSTNSGQSWERLLNGLYSSNVNYVAVDRSHSGHVYAAGGGSTGVYKSANNGDYWVAVNQGLTNNNITDILIDYLTCEARPLPRVYVGTLGNGVFFGEAGPSGVTSWTQIPENGLDNQNVLCLAIDATTEEHSIFAGTENGGVFRFKLDQSGLATWETLDSATGGDIPNVDVRCLAVDASDPGNIHAGADPGLYQTSDGGGTWSGRLVYYGSRSVYDLFIDSWTSPHTIYACSGYGIFKGDVDSTAGLVGAQYPVSRNILSLARNDTDFTFYMSDFRMGVAKGVPQIGPPEAPTTFEGSVVSPARIDWSWTDNATTEFGYKLKKLSPVIGEVTLPMNASSYVEEGLTPNTFYSRRAAAYNAGNEALSNSTTECTLAQAPANLRAVDIAGHYITLRWDKGGNPTLETVYIMEATTEASGPFADPMTREAYWSDIGVNYDGLMTQTDYRFRVYAVNQEGVTTEPTNIISESTIHETMGPRIFGIRFDGIPLVENDVIRSVPHITAYITDETVGTEPASAVNKDSLILSFEAFYVIYGGEIDTFTYEAAEGAYRLSHRLKSPLGDGNYLFTISASDELGNIGSSVPKHVRVMTGDIEMIGPTLVHPAPFRPLTDGGSARISYVLSKDADITIYAYDVGGRAIFTKKFDERSNGGRAGYNEVLWSGKTDFGGYAANGIYVYKIVSGKKLVGTGKIVVYD